MARYTTEEALDMLYDDFDSSGEVDIEEDPLPYCEDEQDGESSPPHSPSPSPSTSL